ncbi:hypothetical protein DXU02_36700 [Rhizobium leguminosarum]
MARATPRPDRSGRCSCGVDCRGHFEGQISEAVGSCWSTGGSRSFALADHQPRGIWFKAFTSSTHYVSVLGKDASPRDYPVR